jgi:hypothetical protein
MGYDCNHTQVSGKKSSDMLSAIYAGSEGGVLNMARFTPFAKVNPHLSHKCRNGFIFGKYPLNC